MNFTKTQLFSGSLIASIAHAIMTNVYPELSYEQSWDGNNYSMQNEYLRGTISFDNDFCVGAIRNETSSSSDTVFFSKNTISDFPTEIIEKATNDTLHYLLLDIDGKLTPCATSLFWADNNNFYHNKSNTEDFLKDFILYDKLILPEKQAFSEWKKYYGMNSSAVKLLKYLYAEKIQCFNKKIILNNKQKCLIPGEVINDECIESLNELNICFG